ncbi:hypothetical protein [Nocardioides ferulae]|uniref:hypothetical protein n=1 Tax=Nocardioides ferulae TaxID=2340821 RepID=UPI000EAE4D96|nr:hypothetical protein [Nocardioides ferulae]
MSVSTPPTIDDLAARFGSDTAPTCECQHGPPREQCGERAAARVSLLCAVAGCDCAVEVHLLCTECVAAWRRSARQNGVRLRVAPL